MLYLLLISLLFFGLAYRLYGRFLDGRCGIDDNRPTPAHTLSLAMPLCMMLPTMLRMMQLMRRAMMLLMSAPRLSRLLLPPPPRQLTSPPPPPSPPLMPRVLLALLHELALRRRRLRLVFL